MLELFTDYKNSCHATSFIISRQKYWKGTICSKKKNIIGKTLIYKQHSCKIRQNMCKGFIHRKKWFDLQSKYGRKNHFTKQKVFRTMTFEQRHFNSLSNRQRMCKVNKKKEVVAKPWLNVRKWYTSLSINFGQV